MTCSSSLLDDSSGIVSGNGPEAAAPVILLLALQFPPDDVVGSASFSSYSRYKKACAQIKKYAK